MPGDRRFLRSLLAAFLAVAVVLAISACGYSSTSKDVAEGQTVKLGHLEYTVVFSRYLNPNDNEDAAYLVGQPPAPPGSNYYGVFFQVQNGDKAAHKLPSSLRISDAEHQVFRAIPSKSLFALPLGGKVEAEEQEPLLDSPAQQGPIQGSLVLFKLPPSASNNRPLTLSIPGPEGPAKVLLDL